MPLFGTYVVVDWSAPGGRRTGRQEWVWVAHVPATSPAPATGPDICRIHYVFRSVTYRQGDGYPGGTLLPSSQLTPWAAQPLPRRESTNPAIDHPAVQCIAM
jgi:hypothetical protein